MYSLEVERSCEAVIRKRCKKNKVLREALEKKIKQVLVNPHAFKPLRAPLENTWRVHILGSFVLIYDIDEKRKVVRLLKFAHHDEAYD
ncbi:type II toxin-antitoxin system RelE/ParE family toxin [Candidatus Micrarchaeota archaeon]|nr:MAG: type II toxin-antitoxin system RelE/ParE family toxin [Candidatus Micrarchaeota archaeon]